MSGPIGPHEAQIRALRESRHEQRQKAALAKISAKPEPKAVKARVMANAQSNSAASSNAPESNKREKSNRRAQPHTRSVPAFDKAAYQRELMRKRRAAAKATAK